MKKILSRIVTLSLALSMVVGATTITSEAKTSKKSVSAPAANAEVAEFVTDIVQYQVYRTTTITVNGVEYDYVTLKNLLKNKKIGETYIVPEYGICMQEVIGDDGRSAQYCLDGSSTPGYYSYEDDETGCILIYRPTTGYGVFCLEDEDMANGLITPSDVDPAKLVPAKTTAVGIANWVQSHGFTNCGEIALWLQSKGIVNTQNGDIGHRDNYVTVNGKLYNISIYTDTDAAHAFNIGVTMVGQCSRPEIGSTYGNADDENGIFNTDDGCIGVYDGR